MTEFGDLDKDARMRLARESVRLRRTLIERWGGGGGIWDQDMSKASPGLVERSRLAAELVKAGKSVADLGCGAMIVERFLPKESRYIPLDCVRRDDRTIVIDLNKDQLPPLGADIIMSLGMLEYIADLPGLLAQIRCEAILSYAPVELAPNHDRSSSGWFNSYTTRDMDTLFESAGFKIKEHIRCPGRHRLWHLDFVG